MSRRNKITQARNEIAKAIDCLADRARYNDYDEELLDRFGVLITVDYDIMDDFYRHIEIMSVEVSGEKRDYPNIAEMVGEKLWEKLNEMNKENESNFFEGLSMSERKEVFEWMEA